MPKIGDFIDVLEPVSPSASGAEVYDRFLNEPGTLAIAVVDADGRPVGLVERHGFVLKMAAEFGRALFARRPIASLMDTDPAIAEADTAAHMLFEDDEADRSALMRGFIAVRDGRYLGVGTALHILRAGAALHRRQAQELGRLNASLAAAEAEARASSRAKTEFLAVMSHEIRTPLNGVLGVAQLIRRKLAQDELTPYVETLIEAGDSLLRLLNDALDLSRAEARGVELEPRPFALDALAGDLDRLWRPRSEEKDLALSVIADAGPTPWLNGDVVRLKQVLNNLMGNALKFTQEGGVSARLWTEVRDGTLWLHGQVTDTGGGVPADQAAHVFEPFNTGSARQGLGGAGLGLAVCRQIVETMQGRLSLDPPTPGQGATFRFHVRVTEGRAPDVTPEETAPPTPHDSLHLLVADDHPTNRFLAAKLLETFGCTCETVETGAEALRALAERRFDLVLMDIKMPVMGGVEATRRLRADGHRLPVIALTANADPADQRTYAEAGMDDVVVKPIQAARLLDAIRRVMTHVPAATPQTLPEKAARAA